MEKTRARDPQARRVLTPLPDNRLTPLAMKKDEISCKQKNYGDNSGTNVKSYFYYIIDLQYNTNLYFFLHRKIDSVSWMASRIISF
jgi:hypothetical protein